MDLSVMNDNEQAIQLYEKIGFERVPVFCVKRKNRINEPLFTPPLPEAGLNPYAGIIVKEARRRGIHVEVQDAEEGFFTLSLGGRKIACRESLSELTHAVAMSRCDDKRVTRRILNQAGLKVPDQFTAGEMDENIEFLQSYGRIVVKPARGEQGQGISMDIQTPDELKEAVEKANEVCETVILEEMVEGQDLRIIVIGGEMVAAAIRVPPEVTGTGKHTIRELIEKQSRRRRAATDGESSIPIDAETGRCVKNGGYTLDDVLPVNTSLQVRKTANLHTGGTIHDVTREVHPELKQAAEASALSIDIPVVGMDLLVPSVDRPDYHIIEANERPGLANHEPAPTAEKFIDLLFPQTIRPDARPEPEDDSDEDRTEHGTQAPFLPLRAATEIQPDHEAPD
jgi:GNAT-family acetyltransferase (TIGR03103 family)